MSRDNVGRSSVATSYGHVFQFSDLKIMALYRFSVL